MTVPMRARRGCGRDDRGAAAVEFALVVPLLLLIVFGIINFGILFSQQLMLNNAVREGDRRAVVSDPAAPRTCADIIASVQGQLSGQGMFPSTVAVKVTQNGWTSNSCGNGFVTTATAPTNVPCIGSFDVNTGGRSLTVEAQYLARVTVPFPPFPTNQTLYSKAVFRCEFTS